MVLIMYLLKCNSQHLMITTVISNKWNRKMIVLLLQNIKMFISCMYCMQILIKGDYQMYLYTNHSHTQHSHNRDDHFVAPPMLVSHVVCTVQCMYST